MLTEQVPTREYFPVPSLLYGIRPETSAHKWFSKVPNRF